MKNLFAGVVLIMVLLLYCQADAVSRTGLNYYYFVIVDENGTVITDELDIKVQVSSTNITVYTDAKGSTAVAESNGYTWEDYTAGLVKFYAGYESVDLEVTDGTNTFTKSGVTPTDNQLVFFLQGQTVTSLSVTGNTTVGGNLAVNGNTALGNAASDTVTILGDLTVDATATVLFDVSENEMVLTTYDLRLKDDSKIEFGTDKDFNVKSSTAKTLDILPLTTDESSIVNFGADEAGVDVKLFPATTGDYVLFDASAGTLISEDVHYIMNDNTQIKFGDAGAEGGIYSDGTTILIDGNTRYNDIFLNSRHSTVTKSENYTAVDPTDVGRWILVDTAAVVITLPAVGTGEVYKIMNIGADGTEIHVDVNGADKILGGCGFSAALDDGDKLTNTGATAKRGDYVILQYGTADGWFIVDMVGTWADGG